MKPPTRYSITLGYIYIPIKIGECLAEKKRQKKHAVTCWFHADLIVFLFQATNHEAVQDVAVGDLVRFRFGNEVRQGEGDGVL